jgi:plasmid stabilization system protein ParE
MKPFILTPRAEQDISDIWDYIAADSIEAADRVLEALEKAMYRLAEKPRHRSSAPRIRRPPAPLLSGLLVPDRLPV